MPALCKLAPCLWKKSGVHTRGRIVPSSVRWGGQSLACHMSKLESYSSTSEDAAQPLICPSPHVLDHTMLALSSLQSHETHKPLTREGGRLGHFCRVMVTGRESPFESIAWAGLQQSPAPQVTLRKRTLLPLCLRLFASVTLSSDTSNPT